METIKVSECCNKEIYEHETELGMVLMCSKCDKPCRVHVVCALCGGEGKVVKMHYDKDSNQFQPTDEEVCICKKPFTS